MRDYTPFVWPPSPDSVMAQQRWADVLASRGDGSRPAPPRALVLTAGAQKITIAWSQPAKSGSPITGWRIYQDTESNLIRKIDGLNTLEATIDAPSDSGVRNYFVSSVNALGKESRKVQAQAQASATGSSLIEPNVVANRSNDATVDSADVDASNTTVRVYGPSGTSSDWHKFVSNRTEGPYPHTSFTGKSYNTTYYTAYNSRLNSWLISSGYKDVIVDGYIFVGSAKTNASFGGSGGTSGGGGTGSGGTGGGGRGAFL